jgi:hypothetical protein
MLGIDKWRFIPYILFILGGILIPSFGYAAELTADYDATLTDSQLINENSEAIAIPYTPDDNWTVTDVLLPIRRDLSGGANNVNVDIYEDPQTGVTKGTLIESQSFTRSDLPQTTSGTPCAEFNYGSRGCFHTVTFDTPFDMASGTLYHIEVSIQTSFQNVRWYSNGNSAGQGVLTKYEPKAEVTPTTLSRGSFVNFDGDITVATSSTSTPSEPPVVLQSPDNIGTNLLATTTCVTLSPTTTCSYQYVVSTTSIPILAEDMVLLVGIAIFLSVFFFIAIYFKRRRGILV